MILTLFFSVYPKKSNCHLKKYLPIKSFGAPNITYLTLIDYQQEKPEKNTRFREDHRNISLAPINTKRLLPKFEF